MPRIVWTRPAVRDFQRLIAFLQRHNPHAAQRAAQAMHRAAGLLETLPALGRPISDDRREFFVSFGRRGYVVRYRIDEDMLLILRIWHSLEAREVT